MESNENRLITLVNVLVDAVYPHPDDAGPVGPWGPWIRDALQQGPLPDPWRRVDGAATGAWWHEHPPGPPPCWRGALEMLAGLAGQVDDRDDWFPPRRPRPNWLLGALLRDLASLNPQPLPPVDPGVVFASRLASVAMQRAGQVGGEPGGRLLLRFAEDWCGTLRVRVPKMPGDPGEPRPPRPEESLVLGAALVRAAGASDVATLKKAADEAGRRIFEHGLSGLA